MKAVNLSIRMDLGLVEPDDLNNTKLWQNGKVLWPAYNEKQEFVPPDFSLVKANDVLTLRIPSGILEGIVSWCSVNEGVGADVFLRGARWKGMANGLSHGYSGAGDFGVTNPSEAQVVESSTLSAPVPLSIYEGVRGISTWFGGPFEKQQAMQRIFALLQELGLG